MDRTWNEQRLRDRRTLSRYAGGESIFSRLSGKADDYMRSQGQANRAMAEMRIYDKRIVDAAARVQRNRDGFLKTVRALHDLGI